MRQPVDQSGCEVVFMRTNFLYAFTKNIFQPRAKAADTDTIDGPALISIRQIVGLLFRMVSCVKSARPIPIGPLISSPGSKHKSPLLVSFSNRSFSP
jgi:hypothetical protein